MAGPDPTGAFDAAGFREGLRGVMLMAMPQDETRRPTFYFPTTRTYAGGTDSAGTTWDPTVESGVVTEEADDPVQPLCAIDSGDADHAYLPIGEFNAKRGILMFFEDEWEEIRGDDAVADGGWEYVTINRRRYDRGREIDPLALFDVTVRRVEVTAEDT